VPYRVSSGFVETIQAFHNESSATNGQILMLSTSDESVEFFDVRTGLLKHKTVYSELNDPDNKYKYSRVFFNYFSGKFSAVKITLKA
jgi:hypothetical protein